MRERIAHLFRKLFSSRPSFGEWGDDLAGGVGVREPRRPRHPTLSGAVALEAPPGERRDTWVVGEDPG